MCVRLTRQRRKVSARSTRWNVLATDKPGYTKATGHYRIEVGRMPKPLYRAVEAKCKREGISMRALILGWLKEWVSKK